jgi:hypothetical protein
MARQTGYLQLIGRVGRLLGSTSALLAACGLFLDQLHSFSSSLCPEGEQIYSTG